MLSQSTVPLSVADTSYLACKRLLLCGCTTVRRCRLVRPPDSEGFGEMLVMWEAMDK